MVQDWSQIYYGFTLGMSHSAVYNRRNLDETILIANDFFDLETRTSGQCNVQATGQEENHLILYNFAQHTKDTKHIQT